MRERPRDPGLQAILSEAWSLPQCAAQEAAFERAAQMAESLGDLDTAWEARCAILSASPAMECPRFENLFLGLAWALAMSDRDPERFPADDILWQYKWVAEHAPDYAAVPRSVLERLVEDMDARFKKAGWGNRAGWDKRAMLWLALGEPQQAKRCVEMWMSTPRDRGSDCRACEATGLAHVLSACDDDDGAIRAARPVLTGELSCATVPHSTYGILLLSFVRLGRRNKADEYYQKGRRLAASKELSGARLIAPYLSYAAFIGDVPTAQGMLRAHLRRGAAVISDADRMTWFGQAGAALEHLANHGIGELDLPIVPGLVDRSMADTRQLASEFGAIARRHAEALDCRNGNRAMCDWLDSLPTRWSKGRA